MSWFRISWVGDQVRDYDAHGPKKGYRIALVNSEGDEVRGRDEKGEIKTFQLGQQPTTPAPAVGDNLFGHVEGWKFVKEQTDESGPGPKNPPHVAPELPPAGGQEAPANQGDQGGSANPPAAAAQPSLDIDRKVEQAFREGGIDERQWSIVRQHSQEMALRYTAMLIARGLEPETSWVALKRRIDRFQRDAFNQPQDDAITPDTPELPRADSPNITPQNAQALYESALKKMPGKYLNMALDNLLGRHIDNPMGAFLSMTQEQAAQFDKDYLQEDAA